jgi:hypothetical protein
LYNNPIENLRPFEILDYFRKSRTDDPSLSVEEVLSKHESILDEWAERNLGEVIPEENKYREVVSGETIADRPEFQKVLKLIESPKIKAILVVEVQRLSRGDLEDAGRLIKLLRYTNTLVITPMKTFDLKDEYDRDMFERELKRGNEFLEYQKKIMGRGRLLSVTQGNYICSKPPFGYDKVTIMEGKRKCPTLAINEEQANYVRMIFNWYVSENIGTQNISNRLNDMQVKSPSGRLWTPDSIRKLIENPTYIGKVTWNKRKAVLVVDDGEFRKTRPKTAQGEVIVCDGKHEAIISEELFQAAQEKRGRSHRTCDNKELRNPLATLLYCECGRAMVYRHSTRGELKYREPRLVCNGQKYCGNGSCSVSEMVDFVANLLQKKIAEFEIEASKGDDGSTKIQEKLVANLEKKLSEIATRELSLWESQLDPDMANRMPPRVFQALTDKLTKEREETETALKKARESISVPIDYEKKRVTFQKALDALLDENKSIAEKNHLLKACIDRIEYHREAPQRILGKGTGRQYTSPPIKLDVKVKV